MWLLILVLVDFLKLFISVDGAVGSVSHSVHYNKSEERENITTRNVYTASGFSASSNVPIFIEAEPTGNISNSSLAYEVVGTAKDRNLQSSNIPPARQNPSFKSDLQVKLESSRHSSAGNPVESHGTAAISATHPLNLFPSPSINQLEPYDAAIEQVSTTSRAQLESAQFISKEKSKAFEQSRRHENNVSIAAANINEFPLPGNSQSAQPDDESGYLKNNVQNSSSQFFREDSSLGNVSFHDNNNNNNVNGLSEKGNFVNEDDHPVPGTNLTDEESRDEKDASGSSWWDMLTSPFAKELLEYFVTDFYPKSILDKVAQRQKSSNLTANATQHREGNGTLSVVYPLVMEGMSILINRLTEDETNTNSSESDSVIRGQIAQGVIDSMTKILNKNPNPPGKSSYIEEMAENFLESDAFNHLLPLVKNVPRGDLQKSINGLMSSVTTNISSSDVTDLRRVLSHPEVLKAILQTSSNSSANASILADILKNPGLLNTVLRGMVSNSSDPGIDLGRVLSQPEILKTVLQNFSNSSGNVSVLADILKNPGVLSAVLGSNSSDAGIDLAGIVSQPEILNTILQNRSNSSANVSLLANILKKPGVLNAVLGNNSQLGKLGNLTNIMEQFMPKNSDSSGMSPKNPLLRSDFASKVLSKSPVAHLGALDEDIKKLITGSLEKAVSRVKINENGQIQINEGMKKVLGKMIESDGRNGTSDSLMEVLKSALESGVVQVGPSFQPEDGKPVVKRNVTHHSPLHRKFREKYGKSSSPVFAKLSNFAIILFCVAFFML